MLGTFVLLLLCSELGVCFFLCFGHSLVLLLLFFLFFLFWSFGFASLVFYMTESCAFVKFVFCLLSVVGEERETSLLLEKHFSNGTSSLASKQCQQATSNGLEIMIL